MSLFTNDVTVEAGSTNVPVTVATPLPAGTNVIGHVIADSGSTTAVTGTVAVTGTFFQATQPVSGTVTATQATGTNLHVVVDSGSITTSGGTSSTATITRVATSNVSTTLLAANANRKMAVITTETGAQNYVALGAAATSTAYSYLLTQTSTLELSGWTGSITLVRGSGTGNVQVTELV
jgi:hypothetical protein